MNSLNANYRDMLSALLGANAEFLVIGAYAMSAHGVPRYTGDIDIWVRNTPENAQRVWRGLLQFGAPLSQLKVSDFESADLVYQIGVAPCRIDIFTSIEGVQFDDAWNSRITAALDGLVVPVIGKADLIRSKRAAGRPKDMVDLEVLEKPDRE